MSISHLRSLSNVLIRIDNSSESLKSFKSRTRSDAVRKEFKDQYISILDLLNVPLSFLKLKDFVKTLDNKGSELSRLIYADHVALYKYNLIKGRGIFSWVVVDTPNQQGQDAESIKNNVKIAVNLY